VFETPGKLALGLLTGILFGFLLQKGRVTKYGVIVDQFLLRDFTVLKIMLTAIVVGAVGIYAFHSAGWVRLHIKPALLGGTIVGGLVFGAGMATLGYCPGTAIGAAAEGSRHAWFGILGMLFGAAAYAELHGFLSRTLLKAVDLGKATFPTLSGIPAVWWIAGLGAASATIFALLERRERLRVRRPKTEVPKPVESVR
jgi:uncharacterized protein